MSIPDEPGRALDAYICERFLHWRQIEGTWITPTGEYASLPLPYSLSVEHAFSLFELLDRRGYSVNMTTLHYDKHRTGLDLTVTIVDFDKKEVYQGEAHSTGEFPLAICRAIVALVEGRPLPLEFVPEAGGDD